MLKIHVPYLLEIALTDNAAVMLAISNDELNHTTGCSSINFAFIIGRVISSSQYPQVETARMS